MSVQYIGLSFHDVYNILPQKQREHLERDLNESQEGEEIAKLSPKDHIATIAIAVGVILALGGIFVLLASYRVLPHGINTMSQAGIWGQIGGYATLGAGLLTTIIASLASRKMRHHIAFLRHARMGDSLHPYFDKLLPDDGQVVIEGPLYFFRFIRTKNRTLPVGKLKPLDLKGLKELIDSEDKN